MRPKGMENLAAFSAREVKRTAAEKREKSIPSQKDSERSKKLIHPNELFEN